MAPTQDYPNTPSSEHDMAGFTPPDSRTKVTAASQAVVKNLKHFINEEHPNTPVTQNQCAPGPDVVRLKQLSQAIKPSQSCFPSNEQGFNLESPIYTTPDYFERFEKWASETVEAWNSFTGPPEVLWLKDINIPVSVGKIVWVECYGGIKYGSLTGGRVVVLATVQTRSSPNGLSIYCSLETYERAPNSMAAAREAGEDWDWVKEKYGKGGESRLWKYSGIGNSK